MEEGTSKAIPLRQPRRGTRAVTVRRRRGWNESLSAGVRRVLEPPRQCWLAGLGSAAFAVRVARAAWSHLVAEGAVAEAQLRRALRPTGEPAD